MSINIFKDLSDWYIKQKETNRSTILLLGIISIMGYLLFKANQKQDEAFAKLEIEVEACKLMQKENIELQRQINALSAEIIVFKASTDYYPFPYWVKNRDGKMLYLNRAYEQKYLTPVGLKASDYINHYDFEVWGHEIADAFRKNDSIVLATNRPITLEEYVFNKKKVTVTKYPFKVGTQVFGVAGVEYEYFKE